MTSSMSSLANPPSRHIRSESAFVEKALLLERPELAAVSDFTIRHGPYRNLTYGMNEGRGQHWKAPGEGQEPALLADASYGVWKQAGRGKIVFDFEIRILRKQDSPGLRTGK